MITTALVFCLSRCDTLTETIYTTYRQGSSYSYSCVYSGGKETCTESYDVSFRNISEISTAKRRYSIYRTPNCSYSSGYYRQFLENGSLVYFNISLKNIEYNLLTLDRWIVYGEDTYYDGSTEWVMSPYKYSPANAPTNYLNISNCNFTNIKINGDYPLFYLNFTWDLNVGNNRGYYCAKSIFSLTDAIFENISLDSCGLIVMENLWSLK